MCFIRIVSNTMNRPILTKTVHFLFLLIFSLISQGYAQEGSKHFEGFYLQGFADDGEKAWDIKGDSADISQNPVHITNVNANRYGEQKVNLTAQQGTFDRFTGEVFLEKDVVISSFEGSEIKTDSLAWKKQDDLVITEDRVTINDPRMKASGTGLKARVGLKQAQLNEDVKVEMNTNLPGNDQTVTITCDGTMIIDQKKSKAVLHNNVVAEQEDKILKSDKMEIYFNIETQMIKKMICYGNVVIIQGENITYSDKAVYNAEDQKLTLLGKPKLILSTDGQSGLMSIGE